MLILILDRNAGTPVYRQVVDQVRFQASSGVLAAGTELPSTRALAKEHGVNPMTVSKAYGELERLGVLERRLGRSHVVAARSASDAGRDRRAEFKRALAPAVQAALQLGIAPDQAVEMFRSMLFEGTGRAAKTQAR